MLKVMAFCHLRENLVINMVKKLMDAAPNTGMDVAKSASKPVVRKTAEATADLIGNKTAVKITSLGKTKSKKKRRRKARDIHSTRKKATSYWRHEPGLF